MRVHRYTLHALLSQHYALHALIRSTYAGAENLFCRALCFRGRVGEGEDEGAWAVLRYLADEGLLEKP
jgi:hypothetical protein